MGKAFIALRIIEIEKKKFNIGKVKFQYMM